MTWHRAGNPQSAPCIRNRIQVNETASDERKLGITAREARTEASSRADGGARSRSRAEGPGDGGHGAGGGRRHAAEPRSRRQSRDADRWWCSEARGTDGEGEGEGLRVDEWRETSTQPRRCVVVEGNREAEWGRRKSMGAPGEPHVRRGPGGLVPGALVDQVAVAPSSQLRRRRATLLACNCKGFDLLRSHGLLLFP